MDVFTWSIFNWNGVFFPIICVIGDSLVEILIEIWRETVCLAPPERHTKLEQKEINSGQLFFFSFPFFPAVLPLRRQRRLNMWAETSERAQPRQGAAAGEHNLPLVLSNLHFPWSLREVRGSSCFPLEGVKRRAGRAGFIAHLCNWTSTLVFF